MQLSIIIPLYNAEKYFRECIDSLYQQDLAEADFEVIVINDGSTDGSLALARQLAAEHMNMTVVDKQNEGQGVARNLGMSMAKGEYIMFVDSDDYLLPHTLKPMVDRTALQQLELCMAPLSGYRQDGEAYSSQFPYEEKKIYTGEHLLLYGIALGTTCSILYHREFLQATGLQFHEGILHEDINFIYKLTSYVKRMEIYNQNIYVYRYNPQSTDRHLDAAKKRRGLESDIFIAADFKDFSRSEHLSKALNQFFLRTSNSQIASIYTRLPKMGLDENVQLAVKRSLHDQHLLPIHGGGLSWRSTLLVWMVNILHLFDK